jgi:predicted transcriptional regulator of viral defense system
MIELLKIPYNEFDYQTLKAALEDYRFPRDRVTKLLQKGLIVRVKKGIYVFSELMGRGPYSREILANMIYGPSYISMEYALAHYQLIPEWVDVVTSVTTQKNKQFHTPVGDFTYRHLQRCYYAMGIGITKIEERQYLIAIPEKALIDKLYFETKLGSEQDILEYLFNDLRLDEEEFRRLNFDWVRSSTTIYNHPNIKLLRKVIGSIK